LVPLFKGTPFPNLKSQKRESLRNSCGNPGEC
jgi:hypothetical protein